MLPKSLERVQMKKQSFFPAWKLWAGFTPIELLVVVAYL
jgi:type II secretory pathway pseudopilin PulG